MIRLSDEQWERIRDHFPEEHIADGHPGRKPIPTRRVLEAVLWILNTGAQWHMLPQSYPNYKTVHRRFQTWCSNEVLRRVLTDVANELRDKGVLDEEESFIDATFAMAKGGGAEIGPTKRGKGMKIMAIVDRHGLPLSVSTHAANHHEVRLVQLCFDFYMIEAKPETLIGDRAYDSDPLDDDLRKDGIEMVAPHRSNRRTCATQDGRRLRRYARLVERFFAWIQWQRRILVRWEFYPNNFLGFGVLQRHRERRTTRDRTVSQSCAKDEGRPLEIGLQEQVSNHFKLLRRSAVVVSIGAKAQGKTLGR